MSIVPRWVPNACRPENTTASVILRSMCDFYDAKIHVGDVMFLTASKQPHVVVEIDNPTAFLFRVKVLAEGRRARYKNLTRWDIARIDPFLSAAYKANASAG
jgi:hypothetical protein